MSDTERTVSHPIVVTVALGGLDSNGVVAAVRPAAAQACGELLGRLLRAAERQAQAREPGGRPGPRARRAGPRAPALGQPRPSHPAAAAAVG